MPFPPTGSVISTDLDNMLRGLNRDNSDHALTGTAVETNLAATSIGANTVGATGGLHAIAIGSSTGTLNTKTIRIYLGATVLGTLVIPNTNNLGWFVRAYIYNTATNAQRAFVEMGSFAVSGGTPSFTYQYVTSAIDTTATQTLKITGQLGNAGDSVTQSMWDVFIVQIN